MLKKILDRSGRRFDSTSYWRQRYSSGGNSGAGSYGRLAQYKAEFINDFAEKFAIRNAIEFGFGDGAQAELFNIEHYIGVEVVSLLVERATERFAERPNWKFMTVGAFSRNACRAELTMSLDVIYHLADDEVFNAYMRTLFDASTRFVVIYSSDSSKPSQFVHVRHRCYSNWISANRSDFRFVNSWRNPFAASPESDWSETSFAEFSLFERVADK